ncbi:MAG: hypothetical protein C4K48_03360 [Candidatus Thorarchaeota archaeon]|nr:MAG: hypothetical protein C4K48_03360 [Candidatus Thorarchaeota archaeon]
MNSEQRKMVQVFLVISGCLGIYAYTAIFTPTVHYCDYTHLEIQSRIGHEVTFTFHNGTTRHYCCVNVSLLAFQVLVDDEQIESLENVQVRCPMCGMLMDWDDPMIVWAYSTEYLNPTTIEPTIVPLCEDAPEVETCESHFLDEYSGIIISNPYVWP